MSVKKRLFISNILMFALPVVVYLLFSWLADRLSWYYLLGQTFTTMGEFRECMQRAETGSRIFTLAGLVLTLVIVNLYLSRGVLKKIEGSMNELSDGLRQLREGNRGFRLAKSGDDEFSAVRADFNSMAAQLQQSVEKVEQEDHNRKELMAGISHDLRSPLTSIRAYAEGLLDGVARTPEDQKQYLTTIRDKARDLQNLVNKLFLFSRMDMGQNEDHPEPVALRDELGLLCRVIAPEYAQQGLDIVFDPQAEGKVLADPDTLHRIVINLAENSCKYKQAERGRLTVTLRETARYVAMDFADDGPGVPPEALPRLFDAFYRSDPSRNGKISGSGLGLAIVSRAVRNMKGRIVARNLEPHGLFVEIQLPKQEG